MTRKNVLFLKRNRFIFYKKRYTEHKRLGAAFFKFVETIPKIKKYHGEVFVFNAGLHAEVYTSYDEEKIKKDNKIAFVRAKTFSNRQRAQRY